MLERERDAKEEEDMEGKEGGDDESSLRISSGKKKKTNKNFFREARGKVVSILKLISPQNSKLIQELKNVAALFRSQMI